MWNAPRGRIIWSSAALSCGAAAACGKVSSQSDRTTSSAITAGVVASSVCRGNELRPSAVPPTDGLWSFQGAGDVGRVAVMLGPTELRGGSTVLTRTVEAIETGPLGREVRSRLDTAVVHLDLLPSFADARSRPSGIAPLATEPAAAYTITPRVLIAAYVRCLDAGAPVIRYLRRDERGHVAVDAMLRRETESRDE